MTRKALGLAAALVLGALFSVAVAQSRRPAAVPTPQSPAQLAMHALIEGRYDDVATLTEKDQFDPTLMAIRGRALVERGKYADAEAVLRPVVERHPTSDAALELGLLLKMLGKPEGTQLLTRVANTADTASRPADLARSARALRALNRFDESNAAYRDAATAAPRDPAIQTAWGEMFVEGRCQTCSADAVKSFQAALREDPKWAPALVGIGFQHPRDVDDADRNLSGNGDGGHGSLCSVTFDIISVLIISSSRKMLRRNKRLAELGSRETA